MFVENNHVVKPKLTAQVLLKKNRKQQLGIAWASFVAGIMNRKLQLNFYGAETEVRYVKEE